MLKLLFTASFFGESLALKGNAILGQSQLCSICFFLKVGYYNSLKNCLQIGLSGGWCRSVQSKESPFLLGGRGFLAEKQIIKIICLMIVQAISRHNKTYYKSKCRF